jgi:haloalkane dehalogenase
MSAIAAHDPFARRRVPTRGSHIAFVDEGSGPVLVFLHGNPTSSYLWRNVIAPLRGSYRCLAPDLIGMGASGRPAGCAYRVADHVAYLDAWFDRLDLGPHVLVGHGWGAALAFHRVRRHGDAVRGVAYCEPVVGERTWPDFPESRRPFFQSLREVEGERLVFEDNVFVEAIPRSVQRTLLDAEMANYRAPFATPGTGRLPTLMFPRELPIDGEPADVVAMTAADADFMAASPLPKLLLLVSGATGLTARQRAQCEGWPNQQTMTLSGYHFVPEDSPAEMATAIDAFAAGVMRPA